MFVNTPNPSFRLERASFDFDTSTPEVSFVAKQTSDHTDIHISLLMGANGTSKSRILSSIVNLLREHHLARIPSTGIRSKLRTPFPERDLECTSAHVFRDGEREELLQLPPPDRDVLLPARLLALCNLIRDRFTFESWEDLGDAPFYYYLGVRQATNMASTRALDRLTLDCLLLLLSNPERYSTLAAWIEKLFPDCELAFSFESFSQNRAQQLLSNPKGFMGDSPMLRRSEQAIKRHVEQVEARSTSLQRAFSLIQERAFPLSSSDLSSRSRRSRLLEIASLNQADRGSLSELNPVLSLLSGLRILTKPSVSIRSRGRWLDFGQLSSGEQNMLSTGARLVGFAVPASLIVIDEPEVSLNVVWQQQYIGLITAALVHAPGSHVLIASHSPYLVADLRSDSATIVVVQRKGSELSFKSVAGEFWGWGSEAILYDVLGIPSGSNYQFSRELTVILRLIAEGSTDRAAIRTFLDRCKLLEFSNNDPLRVVIEEIQVYYAELEP